MNFIHCFTALIWFCFIIKEFYTLAFDILCVCMSMLVHVATFKDYYFSSRIFHYLVCIEVSSSTKDRSVFTFFVWLEIVATQPRNPIILTFCVGTFFVPAKRRLQRLFRRRILVYRVYDIPKSTSMGYPATQLVQYQVRWN